MKNIIRDGVPCGLRVTHSTRLLENVVNESAFVPMRGDGLNESSTVISRLDDR